MPLTIARIAALQPRDKTYEVSDEGRLSVAVSPKGRKTWRLRYYYAPARRDFVITLGLADHIPPREARRQAAQIRDQVAAGAHPFAERKRAQETPQAERETKPVTVEDLVRSYDARLRSRKARTAHEIVRNLNNVLGPWLDSPAEKLTSDKILGHLESFIDGEVGVAKALQAHQQITTMMRYAERRRLIVRSPMRDVPRSDLGETRARDIPWLEREDWSVLGRFFAAAHRIEYTQARRFLLALLATGKRRGQLRFMRWADIYDDTWFPPKGLATRTKQIKPTPLPPSLIEVLLRDRVDASEWVFSDGRGGPFSAKHRYAAHLSELAGAHFRYHDARHALGTWLADNLPADIRLANHALDHTPPSGSTQARYEREFRRFEDQRNALETYWQFMANEAAKALECNEDKAQVLSN